MSAVVDWIALEWRAIVIPGAVFVATLIATFWLRSLGYERVGLWVKKTGWKGEQILVRATRGPSVLWCFLVSAYLAVAVSVIPMQWKAPAHDVLASLLVLSVAFTLYGLARETLDYYAARWKLPAGGLAPAKTAAKATIAVLGILTVLDIWGLPLASLLMVIILVALVVAVVFKDPFADIFAGLQLTATGHVKEGDFVRLPSGEQGNVVGIGKRYTRMRGLDESLMIVPNRKLTESALVNYGRPLKKAKDPFRFFARSHITELTGLRARNLRELADTLKTAPDPIVYYHTHHFIFEHHYLTPEPSNDFGVWVADVLGDQALGERLASVDTFEFTSLAMLRDRLVSIMEESLAHAGGSRDAPVGREFYFLKSRSVVFATPYVAHDLREFVEALRNVSFGSLYFHIFESRMRLGKGRNDFSTWIEENLGENDLAGRIARLYPYTYTLGGLRSALIQLIEKRIK
ncbi:MAG: mechanosensitive ion channel [Chloroflexi bacterium]|nr:mechanosensitive ion channel [Chloroflexota bacterium]